MIKIVYSNTKTYNGIKAYSINLFSDLSVQAQSKLVALPKIEINLRGKKVGGWASQRMLAWTVGNSEVVHSTSHWDICPNTNVITIHDLYPLVYPEIYRITERARRFYLHTLDMIRKKAKAIVVQGPHIKDEVQQFIDDIPIYIIPTKVFVNESKINPYPDDGKLHLLTMGEILGDLPNRKRIYELYEWIKDNPEIDLYHIGRITYPKYLNYARNIHQLGSVSQDAKFAYLKYADKFVFKTIGEGQGFPTMEAMKLGTQAIVNDLPEHRFFLGDKPYYYETKEEFIQAIYKPDKSGQREQIAQYDNWIEKYMKVYEEIS